MWMKLRGFAVTCLVFVGGFAGVLTFQMPGEPRWDEPRLAPTPSTIAAGRRAVEASPRGLDVSTTTAAGAAQASSSPPPANVKPNAEKIMPRTEASGASEPAAPVAVLANDPITRIQQLSYTALSGDTRMKRLVALSSLEAMAYRGEEVAQIKDALAYSMDNVDPVVAAQARALYNRINAGK